MKVRVLAFASARDALGSPEVDVELPDDSDIGALAAVLTERHAELAELWPRLAVAIDGELVRGDVALEEGQEVALLPPVSGGSIPRAALVEGALDVEAVVDAVRSPHRGAVTVFRGDVRSREGSRRVERLDYDAYRPMALGALERIVDELGVEPDELAVAVHHRLGEVPAGETSVVIAAASPHREAAFRACRDALERLKREVPIWKREHYADGDAAWREVESLAPTAPRRR